MASQSLLQVNSIEEIRNKLRRWEVGKKVVVAISVIFFSLFLLFPFFWMLLTSVRPNSDFLTISKEPFAVSAVTLDHYRFLLAETKFLRWLANSLIVATVASVLAIISGVLSAYSLGRLRYRGGGTVALLVFVTYLIPPALLFIPLNSLVNFLNIDNSLWALILTYLTFMIPFITWILSSYFKGLPYDLADAARIDGATRWRAMLLIDVPLVLPGVISVFFFAFTMSLQEYLYALTFLRTSSKFTVALGVVNALQIGDIFVWGGMMAGAVLGSVPVVIIYAFLMDYYIAGLSAGGVKG